MNRSILNTALLEAKSVVRAALGLPDPWKAFRRFENRIHPETWRRQAAVLARSSQPADRAPDGPPVDLSQLADPDLREGLQSRARVLSEFRDKWRTYADRWRVLIHLPRFAVSPAGHSLFRNLGAGLEWLGVPVAYWEDDDVAGRLREFEPTLLLSIDHAWYRLAAASDGPAAEVDRYRRERRLLLGLSSNHFPEEPSRLARRLELAKSLQTSFFYSFQCPEYVATKYRPFFEAGFPVASVEFGANPLTYYPLPDCPRNLNYVFLGSSNAEKWERYQRYLTTPLRRHPGFLLGPGWKNAAAAMVSDDQACRLYSRAKVGLNLHVPHQVKFATELNERAYNLAAAAVPQLTDKPALLRDRFSAGALFEAESPEEYAELFEFALSHPEEGKARGFRSMHEVLSRHTVFHRADSLLQFAERHFP